MNAKPAVQQEGGGGTPEIDINRIPAKLCLALAKLFITGPLKQFGLRERALGGRFESSANYVADRVSNVDAYWQLFGKFGRFGGQTVVEVGCSQGYLLSAFLEREPFNAIGADINRQALATGRSNYGSKISFIESTPTSIPLPDQSVDRIYTVDTIEHLSRPAAILMDCFRILRPGGLFLIHFHPWRAPYGAHLEDILPMPWIHVPFSMDTLLDVASHIYESKGYTPAHYWFDPETGRPRPNPFADREHWKQYLNQMTIRGFKRLLRSLPFNVRHFQRIGFGGKAYRMGRFVKGFAQIPVLDEFFTQAVFCVLQKSAADATIPVGQLRIIPALSL